MVRSSISRRILFHLGASAMVVAGCKQAEQPTADPTPASSSSSSSTNPTAPTTATTTTTTAVPEGTGANPAPKTASSAVAAPSIATANASTTATPSAAKPEAASSAAKKNLGKTCKADGECAPLHCHLGFNGASFSKTGTCQPGQPIYEGRPLVVDGERRLAHAVIARRDDNEMANTVRGSELATLDWEARAKYTRYFRAAAFEEHASIAAFARTICELMALGAPSHLLHKTQAALADEIAHAEGCFGWLARLEAAAAAAVEGEGVEQEVTRAGPFPAAVAPLRSGVSLAADLLRDVLVGGCIGETVAACRAAESALEATVDAGLRSFFERIAEDEARHAALAFETAQWLLREDESLRATVLEEEIATFQRTAAPIDQAVLGPLFEVLQPQSR